jgi:acetolactate synthase regulatory subunit
MFSLSTFKVKAAAATAAAAAANTNIQVFAASQMPFIVH